MYISRDIWYTLTFKLDIRIAKRAAEIYENLVEQLKTLVPDENFVYYMVLYVFVTGIHNYGLY